MRLIVSEKDNAARRLADILSDGARESERVGSVNVYSWAGNRVVGLSGHVVGVDFPDEYSNWNQVDPSALVHADIVKSPTRADIVRVLQRLATRASRVVIATDYDREGELIGKEAFELVRDVNEEVPIGRVRFSSITESEVKAAFADPSSIDFDLAAAGEARQIIDLIWGAALTRFLSLAANRYGEDFISVGRVQSPTLKLIVDREQEIEEFEPTPYWELKALLDKDGSSFESQYYYLDVEDNEAERIWDESEATAVSGALRGADSAHVTGVDRRNRTDYPPPPFNTTQFIRAAGAVGFGAKQAMSIAESLYMKGHITYPRTDNTVYPGGLNLGAMLSSLAESGQFDGDAKRLLTGNITATRGDNQTTDHPPIHPTYDVPRKQSLSSAEWRVYELVARRFMATVASPAKWEHLRVDLRANGLALKAHGKRLVNPGYHAVYPYFNTDEEVIPAVSDGELLGIIEVELEEKETQPPKRFGQSRLIEKMEEMGIGTKSTRHNVIDKLYERGYAEGNPPRPTQLARGVIEAATEYADLVVSESMTAELEEDMASIARGEKSLGVVTDESREMLAEVFDELESSSEAIGSYIREKLKEDQSVGECPECSSRLLIRSGRGGYFIGCDGYPSCKYTVPLPRKGEPSVLDEECTKHGLKEVKMVAGNQSFVHGCALCEAESTGEEDEIIIGECPECGEAGGELAIKRVRTGSRLVGCTRYPECEYSLPLPRRGDIEVTSVVCSSHELPEVVIHNGGDPWELGCPICNYHNYIADDEDHGIQSIDGIGVKTAEKLAEAGIETVSDLCSADPAEVAGGISGVSARQIEGWQSRAEG